MAKSYYYSLGRRKEATATVRVFRGKGEVIVNDKKGIDYFGHNALVQTVIEPLKLVGKEKDHDITLVIKGGGHSGQADAARLAVAKALVVMSEDLRPTLKKAGFLTRDPRVKERKKYGLKRARKAPQFTKR